MPPPLALAGVDLTGDALTYLTPIVAVKGSDQSVTSSVVLVNDTALFLPLAANSTYEVWMEGFWLPTSGGTTPGLAIAFTAAAGATFTYSVGLSTAGLLVLGLAGTAGISAASAGSFSPLVIHGTCVMSATAGNLQFQFAQSASSATPTTMKAGSFITARRIA